MNKKLILTLIPLVMIAGCTQTPVVVMPSCNESTTVANLTNLTCPTLSLNYSFYEAHHYKCYPDDLSWVYNLENIESHSDIAKYFSSNYGTSIAFTFDQPVYINAGPYGSWFSVSGNSMQPTLDTNDILILHKPTSPYEIKVGTIIVSNVTFAYVNDVPEYVTSMHRVWAIGQRDGKTIYRSKGDSNLIKDQWYEEYSDIMYVLDGVIYR